MSSNLEFYFLSFVLQNYPSYLGVCPGLPSGHIEEENGSIQNMYSTVLIINSIHHDTSHSIEVRRQNKTLGLLPPSVETHTLQTQRCEFDVSMI